jgi:MFS family permease
MMTSTPHKKGFYGWAALAGVVLAQFLGSGSCLMSFGVFLPVICKDLNWSRGTASVSMTIALLFFGVPSPLWGVLTNKFGPRKLIISGSIFLALGLAGMSIVHEAWQAYIFFGLAGLGSGMGGFIPSSAVANNWFVKKRSLAMGIVSASVGLGGLVFPTLITLLISWLDWRLSWVVLTGVVIMGCTLAGGLILIRNKPEDLGQMPDGIIEEDPSTTSTGKRYQEKDDATGKWTMKQALQHPTTWLITFFAAVITLAYFTMSGHQIAYLQDKGYSPMIAATTLSLLSGMSVLGSLAFGFMALRINVRKMIIMCTIMVIIALGILMTTHNLAMIFLYVVLFGLANGAITPSVPTLIGNYFGRDIYPQIMGIIIALEMLGSFGPSIAGVIYDTTASYLPAFILLTSLCLLALICILLARRPQQAVEK